MKDKNIRIISAVLSLVSLLTVITIMFVFYEFRGDFSYIKIYGFQLYLGESYTIALGVLGLVALIWNCAFAAYAIINGNYKKLLWQIIRYGYFYGIVIGVCNFSLIISYCIYYSVCPSAIIFLVLTAASIVIEFLLIFTKCCDDKTATIQNA